MTAHTRRSALLLAVVAAAGVHEPVPAQTAFAAETVANGGWVEAVGDLNGDGLPDFAGGAGWLGTQMSIRLSSGVLNWVSAPNVHWLQQVFGIADVDGDGNQDIVGQVADFVVTLRGDGTGLFAGPAVSPLWASPGQYAMLADLDGDGRADLVGRLHSGGSLGPAAFGRATANGTFVPILLPAAVAITGYGAVVTDQNGDSVPDVLVPTAAGPFFLYGTPGGFVAGPVLALPGWVPWAVAAGDVNGDGSVDLVTPDGWSVPTAPTGLRVHPGTGSGFAAPVVQPFPAGYAGTQVVSIVIADLDADGSKDVVVAGATDFGTNPTPRFLAFFGGMGGLGPAGRLDPTLPAPYRAAALVRDFDADGDFDIAFAPSWSTIGMRVHRNLRAGPHPGAWARYLDVGGAGQPLPPSLILAGTVAPGSPATLTLLAPAGAQGLLVVGLAPVQIPLGACALAVDLTGPAPFPLLAPHAFPLNYLTGPLVLPPVPSLSGVRLFLQEFAVHPDYPASWSASAGGMLVIG